LGSVVQSRFPDGANIDQAALYANADWDLSDRQHITGGLRVSDIRIDVPASTALEAARIDVRRLSGDIGWIYSLADTWQLVANAGFGFRAPNIADLGTLGNRPGNRFSIPNTDLKEERVRQLDLGIRRSTDVLRFELMIYALRFEDRITSALTGDTTSDGRDIVQSVNIGRSFVRGAEAGMEIDMTDRISIRAVLNYTWGEEDFGNTNQAADRIPPLSGRLGFNVSMSDHWVSKSWLTLAGEQDRLSDRDVRDVRINPQGTAGWAILGTGLTWTPSPIWEIDLSADNLLDKRYRVHGSGIDSSGRNIRIMLRSRW
jgi:outer membrane receptor protein involved in Fe transport